MTSSASDSMPASGWPPRYLRQVLKNISRTCSREGSNISGVLRLRLVFAQVADQALRAAGLARETHIASVQDQPVVRVLEEFGWRELEQLLLDHQNVLARRKAGAIGHTKDMRVDRHRLLAERGVQHHVRRLAPDAGQRFQRLAVRRHLAAVLIEELLRERHHVLRLG